MTKNRKRTDFENLKKEANLGRSKKIKQPDESQHYSRASKLIRMDLPNRFVTQKAKKRFSKLFKEKIANDEKETVASFQTGLTAPTMKYEPLFIVALRIRSLKLI